MIARLGPLCLLVSALFAQELKISLGPAPGQVLQRDADGRATIKLAGTALRAANKIVEARVLNAAGPLPGFDWKALERVKANKWEGLLQGVPQGGPYSLEVRIVAGTPEVIKDIYIGDLWVLAGQSNMEGVGNLLDVESPEERVRSFDQTDVWGQAVEPLHRLVDAADRVHWRKNAEGQVAKLTGPALEEYIAKRKKGAGLGLPFAKQILLRTGIPIGLIPCAHGGTSMDQWSPDLKDKQGDSLYGATLRRVIAAGGRVKGMLWYQGESDANPKAAPEYSAKMEKLIAAFRQDFAQPDLPFYYVQIGRHVNYTNADEWNQVQEAERRLESRIPRVGMVPAVDLTLDDGIHVSTPDLKGLGRRLADMVTHDLYPEVAKYQPYKRGPRPAGAKRDGNVVRILFAEVNGKLVTTGRLNGFVICDAAGKPLPIVFHQQIDPADGNAVLLHIGSAPLPAGATVRYGAGRDPYVNLNDELDMGTPVFGPLAIE
jgi:sialate O-acetylesterase